MNRREEYLYNFILGAGLHTRSIRISPQARQKYNIDLPVNSQIIGYTIYGSQIGSTEPVWRAKYEIFPEIRLLFSLRMAFEFDPERRWLRISENGRMYHIISAALAQRLAMGMNHDL